MPSRNFVEESLSTRWNRQPGDVTQCYFHLQRCDPFATGQLQRIADAMNNRLDNPATLSALSSVSTVPCRRSAPYPLVLPASGGTAARRRSHGAGQNGVVRSLIGTVSLEQMDKELEEWVVAGQDHELRREAANRMLACFREKGTVLDLGFLRLNALPHCLGNLSSLQSLDVSFNALTMLPERISDLLLLQTLVISGNCLTQLPERIGDLLSLHTLDVSDNRYTELADAIGDLLSLHTLDVSGNKLTALPERLAGLSSLRTLVASGNQLKKLPAGIGDLASLEYLDISDNALSELPAEISNLVSLHILDLAGNQFMQLRDCLSDLSSLHYLDVSNNALSALPSGFGNLSLLQTLDLSNNHFTQLAGCISALSSLQSLRLRNNPLTCLPEQLRDMPAFQLHAGNRDYLHLPSSAVLSPASPHRTCPPTQLRSPSPCRSTASDVSPPVKSIAASNR